MDVRVCLQCHHACQERASAQEGRKFREGQEIIVNKDTEFLIENLTYHEGYSEEQIKPYLKLYELFGAGQLSLEETYDSVQRMYGRIDIEEAIPYIIRFAFTK